MSHTSFYELVRDYDSKSSISKTGPTVYPSHFHQTPEVTYVLGGKCHSVINNVPYDAEKDDILFAPDYYPHSYATSLDVQRFITHLQNDYAQFLNQKTFPCLLSNKTFNREKILPVLEELYSVRSDKRLLPDSTKGLLLKGYFDVLNGRMLEGYGEFLEPRNKQINTLIEILAYIEENSTEKITLDSLANKFGYNKFYFSKFFNSSIGDNLTNYINNTRIRNFTRLYETSPEKNILNLALEVGFDSMPSFYRAFHRVYNCTPKEYFEKTKN